MDKKYRSYLKAYTKFLEEPHAGMLFYIAGSVLEKVKIKVFSLKITYKFEKTPPKCSILSHF